jgi:hypothetical protein
VSAAEFVALVVGAFFLIGIGVGVVAVMALAATRRDAAVHGYPYDRDFYDRDSYDRGYEDDNERFRDLMPPATGLLARLPGPAPGMSGSRRFRGPLDCRAPPYILEDVAEQDALPWGDGTATGIGSMPGDNPLETARVIAGELPALPHLAELPGRGPGADITGRAAALLVDIPAELTPRGWRVAERPGRDLRRARSYLSSDLDAAEEILDGYQGPLKLQIEGPWTLAAALEQPRSLNPALADPGLVADLTASLAEGLAAHVAEVAKRVPGATIIVQVDEPSLTAVSRGTIPTASGLSRVRVPDEEFLRERLRQVTTATSHYTVVHSCSRDVAFGIIKGAGADGLSLDISQLRSQDYDELAEAAEAGRGLFLGYTERPAAAQPGPPQAGATRPGSAAPGPGRGTADAIAALWRRLTLPPARLTRQVVVTPSCGLAGYSPAQARDELRRCAEAARILPEMMGD